MWTSTLDLGIRRILPTRILGLFWRGAYFSALAPLQMRNLPRQPLGDGQGNWVRVRNHLAGICGSDLHLVYADGDLSIAPAALPAHGYSYPGHEVVGEVVEIGDRVQSLHVGDRVVLQSGPNCLSAGVQPPCNACATGNYSLCENGHLPGPTQIGGGWSEEMLVHEQQLFRIPPEMEDEQAVLLEPTAVAVHAVLRRLPRAGEKVLIIGAGTIGLLTLQAVHALAPQANVTVMARHNFQVEHATRLGTSDILYGENSYANVEKATGGKLYKGMLGNKTLLGGYDVIFDTVGSPRTIHDSLRWTRARGTVVVVGVHLHQMKLDLTPVWHQEVNLIGAMAHGMENWPLGTDQQRPTFAIAADLMIGGLIHHERLITHKFALSNYRQALQVASARKKNQAIKVIFDAALLPASSVPNARPGARTRLPRFNQSGPVSADADTLPMHTPASEEADTLPMPTPANEEEVETLRVTTRGKRNIPARSPSHFTMTQSEDFTADFDSAQFVTPKARRTPTPLQFHATGDIPETPGPIGPGTVTNTPDQTLEYTEEPTGNSISGPQE